MVHSFFPAQKNNLIMELNGSKLQKVFSKYRGERLRHLHPPIHLIHGVAWWCSPTDVKDQGVG
jgi:hypothetical protein